MTASLNGSDLLQLSGLAVTWYSCGDQAEDVNVWGGCVACQGLWAAAIMFTGVSKLTSGSITVFFDLHHICAHFLCICLPKWMLSQCTFGVGDCCHQNKLFPTFGPHIWLGISTPCTELHVKPTYDDKLSLRFLLLIRPVQKTPGGFYCSLPPEGSLYVLALHLEGTLKSMVFKFVYI